MEIQTDTLYTPLYLKMRRPNFRPNLDLIRRYSLQIHETISNYTYTTYNRILRILKIKKHSETILFVGNTTDRYTIHASLFKEVLYNTLQTELSNNDVRTVSV